MPEANPNSAVADDRGPDDRDLAARVALHRARGVGPARIRQLEAAFESIADAWSAPAAELKAAGLDAAAVDGIEAARRELEPARELDRIREAGFDVLSWHDPRYPFRLKHAASPPPVLFVRGALDKRDERAVAVVGTRRPSDYGKQMTHELAHGLAAAGIAVVSGLAHGVDGIAHQAALDARGRTIAVVAGGLDRLYPSEHRALAARIAESGAVISEYPLGAKPVRENFPVRNRIIAAMSIAVLVTEAQAKSGTRTTVEAARQEGRAVFALPGSAKSPQSDGTHALIRSGAARLAASADDILEDLDLAAAPEQAAFAQTLPDDPVESSIFDALGPEPLHIDELCRAVGMPAPQTSAALAMMELKGLVRQIGAMTYVRS